MKLLFTSLLILTGLFIYAQTESSLPLTSFSLEQVVKKGDPLPVKMLCDPATNPLEILSCEGEDRDNGTGDNNASNGAFMTWTATGANDLFHYQIYNVDDPTAVSTVFNPGTGARVYAAGADGNHTINLAIGGNTSNACLEPGTWVVRAWDVVDLDGDLQPDTDANGDIIGCYVECTYTFLPSCPTGQPFDVDVTNVGCTVDGSINLINFDPNDVYCDGQATFSWDGPNGFSSSNQNISGLETGTYTFQLTDFYGCTTGPIIVNVTTAPPVEITCGNPFPPTIFGASDGSFEVDITAGEGTYTIEWAGPATGSSPGVDGVNVISGLPAGTYDVVVTDDDTGCTAMCTVTIPDPPCEIAFDVSIDNIGNIILTMTGGRPNFYVAFSGTATASQDDLGPYSTSPITLSANLFEAGEYIFTVYEEDRPDCSAFETFIIEGPDCSTFEFTLENLSEINCGGIDDGAIEISLSGGVNPVLTWVTGPGVAGSNDLSLTNLGPGTYSFQAIDDEGCVLEDMYELTAPPALQFDCGGVMETCEDADDGKIGITLSGGIGPYTLNYTALDFDGNFLTSGTNIPVMDGDTLRNLMPGEYTIQIEDDSGCSLDCSTVVEEVMCPNIAVGGSDQTVRLDSIINATTVNGTGGVILSFGGDPDWTYTINSTTSAFDTTITTSFTPDTALNLAIDTYRLTLIRAIDTIVIDSMLLDSLNISACCISQGTAPTFDFIIRGPECMLASTPTTVDPQCFGEPSGFINLNVTGANGGITVVWDDGALSGPNPTGIPAGTYTATITDDAGCVIQMTVELFDPPPIIVDLQSDPIACAGDSTGQITATVVGAQGNVDFTWFPSGPNADILSGVPAGDYSVVVIDDFGCSDGASITVTELPALDLSCGAEPESNVGTADGRVGFTISGGTPAYSFLLNGVAIARPAQDTFRNLSPGNYTIEVIDANGCMTSCTAVVNPGGCGDFTLDRLVTQPDCDNALGAVTLTPVSANGAVTYLWEHGPNTATLTDLMPGDYSVTATDAFSCTAIQQFTIDAFTDFPTLSVGDFATICDDDCAEIDYVLSGPDPILCYFTVDRAGTQVQGQVDGSSGPGTLTICPADFGFANFDNTTVTFDSVTAGNGCTRIIDETRIITRFPPSTSTITPMICATDTFRLNGEAFHANRITGDVTLANASSNGCDSIVTVNLGFFAPATGAANPTICATDTFRLNGEVFHAGRTSGEVILEDASANGCDSTVMVNVSFFAPAIGAENPTICATDTFRLNGEVFHAGRTSGDVILEDASANGCDSTVMVNVSFFAPAIGAENPTICATDTFRLNGEVFHAGRTSGDVILEGASANGCDSTVMVNVSFFAPALGSVDPLICATDTFFLAGEAFHADRVSGDVILPGASMNGCDSTISVNLSFFAPATAAINPVVCATDTFRLGNEIFHAARTSGDVTLEDASINGCDSIVSVTLDFFPQVMGVFDTTICTGTSFTYGGQLFDGAVEDQLVTLPITTANGCDSLVAVTVRERAVPTVSISGDGVTCDDGILNISITYDGPAEANVELSSNPGEIISLVSGTTTIQRPVEVGTVVTILNAEDGGPCPLTTSGSITVTASDLGVRIDVMSGDGVFAVSCAGGEDGEIMAIPTGGLAPFTFDWNTGDDTQMIDELASGDYSLIVTSGRGCQATANVSLTSPDTMVVQLREVPATCIDPNPALVIQNIGGGVGPYVYSTDGGDAFVPVANFPDTVAAEVGSLTFTLEDSKGCTLNQDFEFAPAPVGDIQITPEFSVITLGDSVEISVLTDLEAAGYLLTPGPEGLITEPSFFVSPDTTTTYFVTAVDDAGCTVSGESLVVVDRFVPVFAPSAFSPNQDGNNDLYRIYGRRNVASFSNFSIFDRWGNRVFDFPGPVGPRDENWGWDGRASDGRLRQSGVYVFSVTVTFTDGRTKEVKGDLVLVR